MLYYFAGSTDFRIRTVMSQSAAASFLADAHVFDRREYAVAVGKVQEDSEVEAMLDRHIRAREIKHVAEDVYCALLPGCQRPDRYPAPPYLVAGRLRPGAVLAYHSALVLHGWAYSATHCVVDAFSPAGNEKLFIDGVFYDFQECRPGIVLGGERPGDGIEIVTCMGVGIRITTAERTMADLFDRPSRGGDTLVESIDYTKNLDGAALVRHMRALGNAAAAAAMGFWLESRRDRHRVGDADLDELRALAPQEPVYALGANEGYGGILFVEGWNVFLPERFVEPEMNGDRWSDLDL